MTEPTSGATQTVVVSPPRLPALLPLLYGGMGSIVTIGGLLLAVGGWRGEVDSKLATLDSRVSVAEANQRTYIPVLVEMKANLAYLADRARRDDDRRERERHQ
jgi:hypothetical protein